MASNVGGSKCRKLWRCKIILRLELFRRCGSGECLARLGHQCLVAQTRCLGWLRSWNPADICSELQCVLVWISIYTFIMALHSDLPVRSRYTRQISLINARWLSPSFRTEGFPFQSLPMIVTMQSSFLQLLASLAQQPPNFPLAHLPLQILELAKRRSPSWLWLLCLAQWSSNLLCCTVVCRISDILQVYPWWILAFLK